MKNLTLTILTLLLAGMAFGQSKGAQQYSPKLRFVGRDAYPNHIDIIDTAHFKPKSQVKTKVTATHDSLVNELDTIPVLFKELVIKTDTVYERWAKGFVVWQIWRKNSTGYSFYGNISSDLYFGGSEPSHYKVPYEADEPKRDKFLYHNYQPVTNKVLTVFKR